MQKRKRFTKEFKLEALRLMKESGKPSADVARELGIRRNQLYKWQDEFNVQGTGDCGRLAGDWGHLDFVLFLRKLMERKTGHPMKLCVSQVNKINTLAVTSPHRTEKSTKSRMSLLALSWPLALVPLQHK